MPELPEVETVRRGLQRHLVGRRIERVEVGRERSVRRTSREAVIAGLTDTVVTAADRRGKYLLLPLDSGDTAMIHLRMSGQVLLAPAGASRPAHTHVVLHLDDGHEVWFVDPRTFGEVVVFDPDRVEVEVPELARLGVDPIADPFDTSTLRRHSAPRRGRSSRCCSTSTSWPGSATSTPTRSSTAPACDPTDRHRASTGAA
jgi:formamidopyrimidine-DNA glycosylase